MKTYQIKFTPPLPIQAIQWNGKEDTLCKIIDACKKVEECGFVFVSVSLTKDTLIFHRKDAFGTMEQPIKESNYVLFHKNDVSIKEQKSFEDNYTEID